MSDIHFMLHELEFFRRAFHRAGAINRAMKELEEQMDGCVPMPRMVFDSNEGRAYTFSMDIPDIIIQREKRRSQLLEANERGRLFIDSFNRLSVRDRKRLIRFWNFPVLSRDPTIGEVIRQLYGLVKDDEGADLPLEKTSETEGANAL